MASKQCSKANNPKVPGFDPEKPKTWIQYYDANNIYGWAMSQALPTGGFEWVDHEEALDQHADEKKKATFWK